MASKKGTGLLMVWADVPADKEAEFNRWYNEEHLAERLAIPGFLSGARYEAVKGGPKHLAVYELESAAVIESAGYKKLGRMDVPREVDAQWNEWYNTVYVPNYEKVPGVIRGRRYRAVEGAPTYLTYYEFENPKVSETPAWNAQRDAVPVSTTMRGHMKHAAGSPGVYVKTFELGR
jgi:hypothetical protein